MISRRKKLSKYLYGASVQGIQGFIFETNKLKEIVGASDLVEQFCSKEFLKKFANEHGVTIKEENIVRNAGGNIRVIFENKNDLVSMVKNFSKYVMQKAYGITISQAVVEFNEKEYLNGVEELERALVKARNQATFPLDARFALMKQTPRTGKAAYKLKNEEYFDKGSWQKVDNIDDAQLEMLLNKLELKSIAHKFPLEMDDIANSNNKVAVIHADGNKMGLMLQQMNKDLKGKSDKEIQNIFKTFSKAITKSTNDAVKEAFEKTFSKDDKTIKFRPIIIGGDDVTVICDANKAVEFTKNYLEAFEKNTENNFEQNNLAKYAKKLTACAGIAFCNKKFPFHYAYSLAEHLCSYSKEKSNREASCLTYHNIQSSYVEDYKTYIKQELTTNEGITLTCAPYYVNQKPRVETLLNLYGLFSDEDIPLGKYREWIRELYKSKEFADIFLDRIDSVLKSKVSKKYSEIDDKLKELHSDLKLSNLIVEKKTPMQDILQLKAVMRGSRV
jgi:hypothetical protein